MKRLSLRIILTVPFLAIIVLNAGLIGYLGFLNGRQSVDDLANQLHKEIAARAKENLDRYLGTALLINQLHLNEISSGQLNVNDLDGLLRHFLTQMAQFDNVAAITFASEKGDSIGTARDVFGANLVVGISDNETNHRLEIFEIDSQGNRLAHIGSFAPDYDARTRPWYQAAVQASNQTWTPIFVWTNSTKIGLDAVVPVFDRAGKLTGVLDTSLTLNGISDFLSGMNATGHGKIAIVDQSGLLVASSSGGPFIPSVNGFDRVSVFDSNETLIRTAAQSIRQQSGDFANIKGSQQFLFDIGGERQIGAIIPYQDRYGLNWWVLVAAPESDYTTQIDSNNRNTLLMMALSLLASVFVTTLVTRWVTKPISLLHQSAEAMSTGNLAQRVTVKRSDEIGELANSFNRMAEQLEKSVEEMTHESEKLRESETRFRTLSENALAGVYIIQDGHLTYVNRSLANIFGYTVGELIGADPLKVIHPDDHALVTENMRRRIAGETEALHYEFRGRCKNGQTKYIEAFGSRVTLDDRPAIVGNLLDITERKHIAELNSRLAAIVDSSDDAIIGKTLDGVITSWNHGAEKLYGYSSEEMTGKSISILLSPSRPNELTDILERVKRGERIQHYETERTRKDGKIIDVSLTVSAIMDSTGTIVGASAIARDITERRRLMESLRESEDRLRRITENMLDMVVETDLQGICKYASQSHKAVLGYDPKDLVGKSLYDFVHPEDLGSVTETIQRALSTGRLWAGGRFECRYRHADGHYVWLENLANILRDEKGEMIGGVIGSRDITERKRAEEALRESEERFSRIFQSTPDSIAITRLKDGVYVEVNKAFTEATGLAREEVIGHPSVSVQTGMENVEDLQKVWNTLREKGEVSGIEIPARMKDGSTRFATLTARVIEIAGQPCVLNMMHDITERKRAEKALQKSEEKYRTLVENINDTVFSTDATAHLTYISPVIERTTGYKADEMIGQPFSRFICPEDLPAVVSRFGRILAGDLEPLEYRVFDKNGDIRYVRTSSRPLMEAGEALGVTGVIIDVTERRKLEAELEKHTKHLEELVEERTGKLTESERKYRSLVENIPDVVWTTDEKGNTVFISPSIASVYGYTQQEIYEGGEKLWLGRIHPEDIERVREAYGLLLTGKRHFDIEYRIQRKDGRWIWLHDRAIGTYQRDGVTYADGVFSDITEHKRIEEALKAQGEALKQSEEKFRRLAERSMDQIFEIDLEGRIVYSSQAEEAISGYKRGETDGMSALDLFPESERSKLLGVMERLRNGEVIRNLETELIRTDGTRVPVEIGAAPIISDGRVVGSQGIIRDISERKRLTQMRDQFMSAVTHELRTPLVPIKANVDYLLSGKLGVLSDKAESSLQLVKRNTDRLNALTDSILDLRRLESGRFQLSLAPLNLREVIDQTVREVQMALDARKQRLRVEAPEKPLQIRGDRDRLSQVLMNLFGNASKFTSEGGTISLHVKELEDAVQVQVSDTGIGIRKEDLERVFEPFAAIEKPTYIKGTGLGLSITRGLIEAHGGKIWAESPGEGKGATFVFTIPREKKGVN